MVQCDSEPKVQKCSMVLFVVLVLVIAMCAWLMSAVQALADNILCVIQQVLILVEVAEPMGFGDMASMLPVDVIVLVQENLSLLPIAAIIPGVLVFVFLFIVILCSVMRSNKSAYSPKCLICLTSLLILLAIAVYAVLATLGFVVTSPEFAPLMEPVTDVCENLVPEINATVTEGLSALEQAEEFGWANLTDVEDQLTAAKTGMSAIDQACLCIPAVLAGLVNLSQPAVAAVIMLVLAYVTSCGLCCKLGCCKSPNAKQVAVDEA